jgi:hypothetical protein
MPRTRKPRAGARRPVERKVSKTYRLTPGKLAAAQRILGTATATETIETALDLVVFRQELLDGTRAMLGVHVTSSASGASAVRSGRWLGRSPRELRAAQAARVRTRSGPSGCTDPVATAGAAVRQGTA